MDFELTEEQRAFADTARQFAQAELAPHAAEWDEKSHFLSKRLFVLRNKSIKNIFIFKIIFQFIQTIF